MIRKQLFITEEQNRKLKARATFTGKSVGEVIRRGIDRELADDTAEEGADWKDAWRQAAGMWADYDEIDEILARRRRRDSQRMERIRKQMRSK